MSAPDSSDFDVVIAGGGMVGTCLALALAPLGLRIAIVERIARGAIVQPSFDERSTALSRSSQRMFEAMGLWPEIRAASTPIRSIHVSDKGRFGFSHIDAEQQQVEALGYVVINCVLGQVLESTLARNASIDMFCPATVNAVSVGPGRAAVEVACDGRSPTTLTSNLLVAADGSNSTVREMLGITVRQSDYRQQAIIGNLQPDRPLPNVAYERFTRDGSIALLPIADGRMAFIWIVAASDAEQLLAMEDDAFTAALQEDFGYRLGAFSRVGSRASYPLQLSRAMRLTTQRSVLVGNAAHGLHPVAAQGFNLGLRDIAALCDCIAEAPGLTHDRAMIGSAEVLRRYADWRKADQRKLVRFTDGLVRLFGSGRQPLRTLRNVGMLGFDLVPGVREEFARQTMGLAGRLPRLSRGVPL